MPAAFVTVVVAGIIVYYGTIQEKVIFPNLSNYQSEHYTDIPNGGTTNVIEYLVTDSVITFGFQFGTGFYSPYAGIQFTPTKNRYIDLTQYNQISIELAGINIDRVGIALYTPPLEGQTVSAEDEALYHCYLNISERRERYHLPLSQFQHPDWWEDRHHIPKNQKKKPDFHNVVHLNVGSAYSAIADNRRSLLVYSIVFSRDNEDLYWWLLVVYIVFVVVLFGCNYLFLSWHYRGSQITVSYQPLTVSHQRGSEEKCVNYINSHYQESNLTLEKISEETGVSARRITFVINNRFNCNFKTYLNRIRIHESKNLLLQSDLNIGEIAFKVGFNNQSHFNRVFKTECQLSPTEFRENGRK